MPHSQPPTHIHSSQLTPTIEQSQTTNPLQQQLQQSIKSDYEVITKLGSGAYGHVWKVKDKKTDEVFALKKVFSAFQNQVDAQRTYRQIVYLQKLAKHQNVVKLKRVIKADNDMDLYLLFQYMESDLFYAIKEDLLNQLHKKYIIYQLAKCLKFVHSAGLVHRDVKPSNILINPNCQIRLCDFGLSRTLWKYDGQKQAKLTQFIATRWYRAPQVLFGSQLYNTKSDMWSLGCLIYELYARRPLLPGNDTVQQIQKVLEFKGFPNAQQKKSFKIPKIEEILTLFDLQKKPLNEYFKYITSEEVKEILIHLLEYNPQKRWSATDLLNCSFLQQFRQFQSQIQAEKQIKTGINDNERKSVEVYRTVIYNAFVYDTQKKSEDLKQKLHIIRQSRDSTHRGSGSGNRFGQERKQELLTEQRKSRHLINTKSSASLHMYKGSTGKQFANTQRLSHRKNMSSHTVSKVNDDLLSSFNPKPQKALLTQMKSKKHHPQFEFSLHKCSMTNPINISTPQSKQPPSTTLTSHTPCLRSSTHTSKIPSMIQQRLFKQKTLFQSQSNANLNIENTRSSKLLRASMSKQKKSPYVMKLQQNAAKCFQKTNRNNAKMECVKAKQNFTTTNQGNAPRKLKRKAVAN